MGEDVRVSAVVALGQITNAGNKHVMLTITSCLEDASKNVRWAAVEALGKISPVGHQQTVRAVKLCLRDGCAEVRRAAIRVLQEMGVSEEEFAFVAGGALVAAEDEDYADISP